METRVLGCTGKLVSVVGLGTWQIGGSWSDVHDSTAFDILGAAVEARVTLFDTADVYGDGHSERLIGRFLPDRSDADVFVATKMGRRVEQVREIDVLRKFREWNDRSRRNLGVQSLDLVQLHYAPPVYSRDEVYDALDTMVDEGRISKHGVSVEPVAEALMAIARPRVASVQIILYKHQLTSPDFWAAVRSAVTFTIVGVFRSWLVGLGLALLLRTRMSGRGTFKVLLLLPWVVPVVVNSTSRNWLLATPDSPIPNVAKALRFGDVLFLANPIALMMTFVPVMISSVLNRQIKKAAIQ